MPSAAVPLPTSCARREELPSRRIDSGQRLKRQEQKKNRSVVSRVAAGLSLVGVGGSRAPVSSAPASAGERDHAQHGGGVLRNSQKPLRQRSAATSPRNRGEDAYPLRAVCRSPARRRLGGVPGRASRRIEAVAVGAGADGDSRKRTGPSAGPFHAGPHPCRGPRCPRRAVGDGRGPEMRSAFGRHRRDLGRPQSARFYRDAAARRRVRAVWRGRLFDSARRPRQFERRTHALADRIRAVACQRARPEGAGHAGVGCRAVPSAWRSAGAMDDRA